MGKLDSIKDGAKDIGSCDKIRTVRGYKSLTELFYSPQGREFCQAHNYPSIEQFREIKQEVFPYNVFVDSGDISLKDVHRIALVGDTHAKIEAEGVDDVFLIILMHGATARIKATKYAVINIVNISGGEVAIDNDITTKIL